MKDHTKISIQKDGNQWSVLWGGDLQEGIAGFGDTPEEAMDAFALDIVNKSKKSYELLEKENAENLEHAKFMMECRDAAVKETVNLEKDLKAANEKLAIKERDYEYVKNKWEDVCKNAKPLQYLNREEVENVVNTFFKDIGDMEIEQLSYYKIKDIFITALLALAIPQVDREKLKETLKGYFTNLKKQGYTAFPYSSLADEILKSIGRK